MNSQRYRLGLIFNFNPKWMGGIIYLLNISKILNFLDDKDKPELYVFYPVGLKRFVDEIEYPYLKKVEWSFPSPGKGFIMSKIKRKNVFVHDLIDQYKLQGVYPMHDFPVKSKQSAKQVSWYADIQHKHYPEFFTRRKHFERDLRIKYILKNASDLVFSSQAVKDDFINFFRIPDTIKTHIYHFVSVIDNLPEISANDLRRKYKLPEQYYMISNQFHKHKNHKVAFLALKELKKRDIKVHFAITGKFPEQPNSPYMAELHQLINDGNLKEQISFLGLIPRGDQLLLMKNAKAILQPSLFEGWSTVIEDARSLQVPVIAASLQVNIEQLKEKGTYFEPHDFNQLAQLIEKDLDKPKQAMLYEPYEKRMKDAAYSIFSIFSN